MDLIQRAYTGFKNWVYEITGDTDLGLDVAGDRVSDISDFLNLNPHRKPYYLRILGENLYQEIKTIQASKSRFEQALTRSLINAIANVHLEKENEWPSTLLYQNSIGSYLFLRLGIKIDGKISDIDFFLNKNPHRKFYYLRILGEYLLKETKELQGNDLEFDKAFDNIIINAIEKVYREMEREERVSKKF